MIVDPASGERYLIRRTSAETGGASFAYELWTPAGLKVPPHVHPRQQESFRGIEGTLRVRVGPAFREIGPGDKVVVPPGTVHALWNDRAVDAHLMTELIPALRTEDAMRAAIGVARDHPNGMPVLQQIVLLQAHLDEICLPRIPLWLQKAVFGVVAAFGRARGYRADFPEYARWSDVS